MNIRTASDIGALIRDRRRSSGLDQKTLADRVGVSRQWIIEIERGKPRAALEMVLRTLDVLGIRLSVDDRPRKRPRTVDEVDIDAIVERARKRAR